MLEGMRMGEAQRRPLADVQQWAHGKPGWKGPGLGHRLPSPSPCQVGEHPQKPP